MKVTIVKNNEDRYIILETEERSRIYKAEMLVKTSEVFEATFLREENKMTDEEKERILGALNYKDKNGEART